MERCLVCGSDDLIHYSNGIKCHRCGSMKEESGWSYDPDEIEENIYEYDHHDDLYE